MQLLDKLAPTVTYPEAVRRLTGAGFCLWDVLASSSRKGSLDAGIDKKTEVPAAVREFVELNPSIRRICFATGKGSARKFHRHFKRWVETPGTFIAAPNPASQAIFGRPIAEAERMGGDQAERVSPANPVIELCVMHSVSPAFCAPPNGTYAAKRQQWFEQCFLASRYKQ